MLKVFGLRGGGVLLEKATISWIMEGAEKVYAGSQQQIVMYLKVRNCIFLTIRCKKVGFFAPFDEIVLQFTTTSSFLFYAFCLVIFS